MEWLLYVIASLFFLFGAVCVVSVALSLPGTWVLIATATVIEFADSLYLPPESRQTFPWWLLIGCVLLASLGELLEFLASALGAKKAGSSTRGMIGAVLGGFIGAIVGAPFGLIVGAFIGAVIGTFLGAMAGELLQPAVEVNGQRERATTVTGTLRPATGATVGRVLGTLSKLPIAVAVWVVLTIAAFWP